MVFNILFKDRVTKPQKKMLINLLRETKFMEGKKEKEWYWEKIQAALNTIGPKKTIIQWKKCWRDMRLTTRKKLAELKRCQMAGGSPPPGIELNQEDNDIIDIVGTEYFYEEMNGELKAENFMSTFDYVPEHFCDAILTAASVSGAHQQQQLQQQQQQQKEQQQAAQQQHHHDADTSDAPGSSNHTDAHGGAFPVGVPQLQAHNGEHAANSVTGQSNILPQHPAFHNSLHSHLLRRQHHNSAAMRESAFEEKLLQLMQDAFPKKIKKKKQKDPDKLFLLSLYEEMRRVPEEIRLDAKAELIQVLKKYQKKSGGKADKSHSQKQNSTSVTDKIQLTQNSLSHSMYQLQKKYDRNEKEPSPQSQAQERVQQHVRDTNSAAPAVTLHPSQQIPHTLFQLQKKYEETAEKVHQQNEQRKHVENSHQQHPAHQQPPPTANDQHLHHPQLAHSIMFPLPQVRNEQPPTQQHHQHNPHQPQHPHQQQSQHHPSTIFGSSAGSATMNADRPPMSYENVG